MKKSQLIAYVEEHNVSLPERGENRDGSYSVKQYRSAVEKHKKELKKSKINVNKMKKKELISYIQENDIPLPEKKSYTVSDYRYAIRDHERRKDEEPIDPEIFAYMMNNIISFGEGGSSTVHEKNDSIIENVKEIIENEDTDWIREKYDNEFNIQWEDFFEVMEVMDLIYIDEVGVDFLNHLLELYESEEDMRKEITFTMILTLHIYNQHELRERLPGKCSICEKPLDECVSEIEENFKILKQNLLYMANELNISNSIEDLKAVTHFGLFILTIFCNFSGLKYESNFNKKFFILTVKFANIMGMKYQANLAVSQADSLLEF